MNKTYKVRATRSGALQVVSELTSSVASIGTKTVLAATMGAAFAAASAGAFAATDIDLAKTEYAGKAVEVQSPATGATDTPAAGFINYYVGAKDGAALTSAVIGLNRNYGDKADVSGLTATFEKTDKAQTLKLNGGTVSGFNASTATVLFGAALSVNTADHTGNDTVAVEITGVTFQDNTNAATAARFGGAMSLTGDVDVSIKDSTFTGNSSNRSGAIHIASADTTVTLENTEFTNNKVTGIANIASGSATGGAISVEGTLKGSNVTFTGNSATHGGAVYLNTADASVDLTAATFDSNTASTGGGAIFLQNGSVTLTNASFTKNEVTGTGVGGAIRADSGTLKFVVTSGTASTATGNKAGNADQTLGAGGFLYAGGTVEFDIDGSMIVGDASTAADLKQTDSIRAASSASLTKTGSGSLVLNSFTHLDDAASFTVKEGTVTNNSLFVGGTTGVTVEGGTFQTVANTITDGAVSKGYTGTITVKEGGTLAFTTANSNYAASTTDPDAPATEAEAAPDQLLLAEQTINLAGGQLQGASKVKVGTNTKTATINVNQGTYAFDRIIAGAQGNIAVANGATLDVADLNLSGYTGSDGTYKVAVAEGATLKIGTVTVNQGTGALNTNKVVNSGSIDTAVSNVLTFTRNEQTNLITGATLKAFGEAVTGNDDAGKILDDSITAVGEGCAPQVHARSRSARAA